MQLDIPRTGAPTEQAHIGDPAHESCPPPAAKLTRDQQELEVVLRICAAVPLSIFLAVAISQFIKDPSRITVLLLGFGELLTIGLAISTRVPRERDWNLLSVLLAVSGTFYFLAFRLEPGVHLIPEAAAAGLQISGIAIQVCAKLTLRRSFGILPANRGVVASGPYRVLRHPIYFGYLLTDIGFLLRNFGIQNVVVLSLLLCLQISRILREERVLVKDSSYRAYMSRVRYRLIYGVF